MPRLDPHAYVLAVPDIAAATAYFVDILGFSREWNDGDNWQALVRDGVRIMVGHCPDALPPGDHAYFAFIATDDVDALFAEFAARGAIIRSPPRDQPWGWREVAVATPQGHRLMFAQAR